ncbi:5'-hydroxyaverantin dehydrogenase [Drechslerella dactyloides]|uniref:5'-hydroxyaverantin dehydrogenase n=1 Tax=Drechslerella dactyloides TaxID=74499 RepID=A0AAD6J437_DREDA|nr:5'-hydroxyaverantin dehydrogenase [Drechslerella dactyloides]
MLRCNLFREAIALSPKKAIDSVIANAGITETGQNFHPKPFTPGEDPPPPNLLTLDVNITGVVYTAYLALQYFRNHPHLDPASFPSATHDRSLVLVGSIASLYPLTHAELYNTSKHAVLGLFRALRQAALPDRIRINLLCPYWIETPIVPVGAKILLAGTEFARIEDVVAIGTRCLADCSVAGHVFVVLPQSAGGVVQILNDEPRELDIFNRNAVRTLNKLSAARGWMFWGRNLVYALLGWYLYRGIYHDAFLTPGSSPANAAILNGNYTNYPSARLIILSTYDLSRELDAITHDGGKLTRPILNSRKTARPRPPITHRFLILVGWLWTGNCLGLRLLPRGKLAVRDDVTEGAALDFVLGEHFALVRVSQVFSGHVTSLRKKLNRSRQTDLTSNDIITTIATPNSTTNQFIETMPRVGGAFALFRRKWPTPVCTFSSPGLHRIMADIFAGEPMAPFIIAGGIVYYGVWQGQNALSNTDEFRHDPRNKNAKPSKIESH